MDNRQEPVDNRQEPVDNRQEPLTATLEFGRKNVIFETGDPSDIWSYWWVEVNAGRKSLQTKVKSWFLAAPIASYLPFVRITVRNR